MFQTLHHFAGLYHSVSHLRHTFSDAHDEMAAGSIFHRARETVDFLHARVPGALSRPRIAIVCGSGLGGLAELINPTDEEGEKLTWETDYKDVPSFPVSSGVYVPFLSDRNPVLRSAGPEGADPLVALVPGHEGKLIFGTMGAKRVPVVLLKGRAHFYEGLAMEVVTFATRVCKLLGVETMILTNAAGGLNPDYNVGDIVCLNDHLNLAGLVGFHPLRGPNEDEFGVRFPPLSDAYDVSLRQQAHRSWKALQQDTPSQRRMHEGVYAFVAGPSYETRAECRMLRLLGADVVGMSTVPEIVVARHAGMRVLAFSLVTNQSVLEPTTAANAPELQGLSREELDRFLSRGMANHEEVLEAGRMAAVDMQGLVLRIVSEL